MLRCVVTIASVALLSGLLSHVPQAQGQREFASTRSTGTDWVRTVDGWEPSIVLELDPGSATLPMLHPLLVAGFQLTASLFALLAFPAAKAVAGDRTARSVISGIFPRIFARNHPRRVTNTRGQGVLRSVARK